MKPILLQNLSPELQDVHYKQVLDTIGVASINVQHDVEGKGKGLVANRKINKGETVFTEVPLVNLQHIDNQDSALVCNLCLRFVGPIERQIGHKLQGLVKQLTSDQQTDGSLPEGVDDDSDGDVVDLDAALEAGERLEQMYSHVTPEQIAGLCSGAVTLPMSADFQLPPSVPCRRGCGALYCSPTCEQQAWEHHHCLLCTSSASASETTAPGPSSGQQTAAVGGAATSGDCGGGLPCSATGTDGAGGAGGAGVAAGQARPPAPAGAGPSSPSSSPSVATSCSAGVRPSTTAAACGDGGAGAGGSFVAPGYTSDATAGPSSSAPAAAGSGSGSSGAAQQVPAAAAAVAQEELYGIRVDRRAVVAFVEHSRATNEIFLLAAQVVAATLLRAAKLLQEGTVPVPYSLAATGDTSGSATAATAASSSAGGSVGDGAVGGEAAGGGGSDPVQAALLAAWRPYQYGWKKCWWESVAVPDDVDDEEEFRGQLRELACDSLELLSAAISDPRFGPELLHPEVYGSIVGMFELNNLGLSVASPVEDFFLAVDEMDEGADKMEVTKVTQPLLDALDKDYATPCEATAFLALQSCVNHSCDPNCTATCDTGDRTVAILAERDIEAGEEITLSYIDVSLPYKQRQEELRDYGFVCRCDRCVTESAAARSKRAGAKGFKVGAARRR